MASMISSTAIFVCSDIEATLSYYKGVLGFETSWTYGDPPVFGLVSKGGVTITFHLQPELAAKVRGHPHGIKVDDIDALYRMHRSNGAVIVSEIQDKPWGLREYVIEDLNGYLLTFSGVSEGEVTKSVPFPSGVSIEPRKPTADEFLSVAGCVFDEKEPAPELLESTWSGVVALSPDREAIGVLRVMKDAEGWYSIWDVAVLPEWQGHHIGSSMMRHALAMIREVSPGANVYLFTFKHGFYERLGFEMGTVSTVRV